MSDNPEHNNTKIPGPWPWYVFLAAGFAMTGLFPWLMISLALWRRGRRPAAALAFFMNLAVCIVFNWLLLTAELPWQKAACIVYLFNFTWSAAAWFFQKKAIGPARRRYVLAEWKSWLAPLFAGAVMGLCVATAFSVPIASQERKEMKRAEDILDRDTMLPQFLSYSLFGIAGGLILGCWWAGERGRFGTGHVVTFLSALTLNTLFIIVCGILLVLVVEKGGTIDSSDWKAVPPWISGFSKFLLNLRDYNMADWMIVPLFFGAASGVRDFFAKTYLIPLALLCSVPMLFDGNILELTQGRIVYEMSSPDSDANESAHKWAGIMLKRYPDHEKWPEIAMKLARYRYRQGHYAESEELYGEIVDRYDSNKWYWEASTARAILGSRDFGKPPSGPELEIPMVDYEKYLSRNWMALLSVIRYWEGADIPESGIKIRLKKLSKSDDKILLNPLIGFAELHDAAGNLGYETLILPTDLANTKSLISAGVPVIHQLYFSFIVLFGYDESRSVLLAHDFNDLLEIIGNEARKEAREILSIEEEGRGKSKKRLARIAEATEMEIPSDVQNPVFEFAGPFAAIVLPSEKIETVAASLNMQPDALRKESEGCLATLIGLSWINSADPVQAVEWAKIGAEKTDSPMPLYVAHMAGKLWELRIRKIRTELGIEERFPELKSVAAFFDEPENTAFLEKAGARFETGLEEAKIPWIIIGRYISGLDISDPVELDQKKRILRGILSNVPRLYYWRTLANTCEWAGDMQGMVEALEGWVSCKPMEFDEKLRLAYGHVLLEQYADAKKVLSVIDPGKVKYDADYSFCLGAIAEWEGDDDEALKKYGQAADIRRYKPIYHFRHGRLLLSMGKDEEAKKVLEWVARIDAGEKIKSEAKTLLAEIDKKRRSE